MHIDIFMMIIKGICLVLLELLSFVILHIALIVLKSFHVGPGLQIRVCIGKIFSLFLIQNICCAYSNELSQ